MAEPMEIESALAAIGVCDILHATPKYSRKQAREARDLPKAMREAFDEFFKGDGFKSSEALPPFDYDEVLELVSAGQTPEQAQALAKAVPDPELAMELGIEANRVLAWANQSIPRAPRTAATGATMLDPPDAESLAQFRTRWEVACDPMVVVRDVLDGSLDADQVATIALLYPSLYAEMRQACVDAMTAAAMEHGKDWEPSPDKEGYVRTLLQQTATDLSLAASIQESYQQQAAAKPKTKAKKAPARSGNDDADSELTPGQRAAAG